MDSTFDKWYEEHKELLTTHTFRSALYIAFLAGAVQSEPPCQIGTFKKGKDNDGFSTVIIDL